MSAGDYSTSEVRTQMRVRCDGSKHLQLRGRVHLWRCRFGMLSVSAGPFATRVCVLHRLKSGWPIRRSAGRVDPVLGTDPPDKEARWCPECRRGKEGPFVAGEERAARAEAGDSAVSVRAVAGRPVRCER